MSIEKNVFSVLFVAICVSFVFVGNSSPLLAQVSSFDQQDFNFDVRGEWQGVPIDGMMCRDGSPSGIAVRLAESSSNRFIIFLAGGNICLDSVSCRYSPSTIKHSSGNTLSEKLVSLASRNLDSGLYAVYGDNELAEGDVSRKLDPYHVVYIPYCTGDLHLGRKQNGDIQELFVEFDISAKDSDNVVMKILKGVLAKFRGPISWYEVGSALRAVPFISDVVIDSYFSPPQVQQFVGSKNVGYVIEWLKKKLGPRKEVIIMGESAGAHGAAFSFDNFVDKLSKDSQGNDLDHSPEFKLLLDSAFLPSGLSSCFIDKVIDTWDPRFPLGNSDIVKDEAGNNEVSRIYKFLDAREWTVNGQSLDNMLDLSLWEKRFVSSDKDFVIRSFLALSQSDCTLKIDNKVLSELYKLLTGDSDENLVHAIANANYQAQAFSSDLKETLRLVLNQKHWHSFVMDGDDHVLLSADDFNRYRNEKEGRLADWIEPFFETNRFVRYPNQQLMGGGEYSNPSDSAAGCMKRCEEREGCKGFQWVHDKPQSCWFFDEGADLAHRFEQNGMDLYWISTEGPVVIVEANESCFDIYPNQQLMGGGEYSNPSDSAAGCMKRCEEREGCKGFQWVHDKPQSCWFFDEGADLAHRFEQNGMDLYWWNTTTCN